jgi:hydrophobic/amphiphilic exporter-1 (mainly G- bacteria), HAE1 family
LIIPGLYYLFAQLEGGRKLLKDESHQPLSERFEHEAEAHDTDDTHEA